MLLFISSLLKASPPEHLIENFNLALTQYTAALHCIVPVFIYMVKCRQSVFWNVIFNITLSFEFCVNGSAFEHNFVKEQVLHWNQAEPRPAGRPYEAFLGSCSRKTRQHVTAWVQIIWSASEDSLCQKKCTHLMITFWVELNANTLIQVLLFFSALLKKAHSMPFQVKPSTMESVVKGLYTLRPGKMLFTEVFWLYCRCTFTFAGVAVLLTLHDYMSGVFICCCVHITQRIGDKAFQ